MEDHKDELVLILAGYQKEMENFLLTNPGLRSRFPIHIDFPDYNQEELLQIAEQMCAKRQYQLSPQARITLVKTLTSPTVKETDNFGNARTVRNTIEKAMRRQAVRLMARSSVTRDDLILIEPCDLPEGEQ
jgi:stage V sporulation protein K